MDKFWQHYDTLYAGKDYAAEVKTITPLLGEPGRLLDIGCGTGEHAIQFVLLGFSVCGVDTDMGAIEIACGKDIFCADFVCSSIEKLPCREFDAAVSLFNVVNYIMTEAALVSFFAAIRQRLKVGAPFIFDCWNGEAALADPPRVKITEYGTVTPALDREARRVHMKAELTVNGDSFTHEYDHRLWTIAELKAALWNAGFTAIHVAPWMRPAETATANDWKIMFICRNGA